VRLRRATHGADRATPCASPPPSLLFHDRTFTAGPAPPIREARIGGGCPSRVFVAAPPQLHTPRTPPGGQEPCCRAIGSSRFQTWAARGSREWRHVSQVLRSNPNDRWVRRLTVPVLPLSDRLAPSDRPDRTAAFSDPLGFSKVRGTRLTASPMGPEGCAERLYLLKRSGQPLARANRTLTEEDAAVIVRLEMPADRRAAFEGNVLLLTCRRPTGRKA